MRRRRPVCRRNPSRSERSWDDAVVHHFSVLVDPRSDVGDLGGERTAALQGRLQQWERPAAGVADRAPDGVDGHQECSEPPQLCRFEGQSFDGEVGQDLVEVRRGLEADGAVRLDVRDAFGGGGQRCPGAVEVRVRPHPGEPRRSEGRQREAADDFYDPVETRAPGSCFRACLTARG